MPEPTTCRPACPTNLTYCANCDLLVGLDVFHVIDVAKTGRDVVVVTVESAPMVMGCPTGGVVAHSYGRRTVTMVDSPCDGKAVC